MKAFPFLFLLNVFSQSGSLGLHPALCCALWPSSSKALKRTNSPGFGGKWAAEHETLPRVPAPPSSVFPREICSTLPTPHGGFSTRREQYFTVVLILPSRICSKEFKNYLVEVQGLCVSGSFSGIHWRFLLSVLILEAKHTSNGSWGVRHLTSHGTKSLKSSRSSCWEPAIDFGPAIPLYWQAGARCPSAAGVAYRDSVAGSFHVLQVANKIRELSKHFNHHVNNLMVKNGV